MNGQARQAWTPPASLGPGPLLAAGRSCWRCGFHTTATRVTCPRDGARLVHPIMSPQDDPFMAQVVDGRYVVCERLGEGGIAAVYEARPVTADPGASGPAVVALKVLKDRHRKDAQVRGRFIREARLLSELRHPGLLEVHDLGELPDGSLYMVMERLAGESLHQRHVRMPLSYEEVLLALEQLCAALAAVHELGIVHGDVKPANVHVSRGGEALQLKLLDFGVARTTLEVGQATRGPIYGTPAYMSLEQATGRPYDHRVDLFALGVTAYELLADRLPFGEGDDGGISRKLRRWSPPRLSSLVGLGEVPSALDQVVAAALSHDPEARPASTADFAALLRQARAELRDEQRTVVPALRVPSLGLEGRWRGRGRRLLARAKRHAVLVTLALAAALLGTYTGLM